MNPSGAMVLLVSFFRAGIVLCSRFLDTDAAISCQFNFSRIHKLMCLEVIPRSARAGQSLGTRGPLVNVVFPGLLVADLSIFW